MRAAADVAPAPMLLHGLLGDRDSQADPQLLGREIRIENPVEVFLADARSGVRNRDLDGPVRLRCLPLAPRLGAMPGGDTQAPAGGRLRIATRHCAEAREIGRAHV